MVRRLLSWRRHVDHNYSRRALARASTRTGILSQRYLISASMAQRISTAEDFPMSRRRSWISPASRSAKILYFYVRAKISARIMDNSLARSPAQ
eukprot:7645116-Pyramimonas_sp.AAC.1